MKIAFNSRGAVGLADGESGEVTFPVLDVPGQVSWQAAHAFADGRRLLLMSVEGERTWEGDVRSHLWVFDIESGELSEIAAENRPAAYMPAAVLLPDEERIVANPVVDGEQRLLLMNLDGSGQQWLTHAGEGFTYGVQLSPDGARLAFHAATNQGYQVFTMNLDGTGRTTIAAEPGHLFFGPDWSPDGRWLVFCDCIPADDPGHDWADLCLAAPDGSSFRRATTGQRHWFATSYGDPETRGGGSNVPRWMPDGSGFMYTRALPDSRTAWPYQTDRPDTDHFNRDYRPDEARGGTELCLVSPEADSVETITWNEPPVWDFRATPSRSRSLIAFCRAAVGEAPALWAMDADGGNQRMLTRGRDDRGADHPLWLE